MQRISRAMPKKALHPVAISPINFMNKNKLLDVLSERAHRSIHQQLELMSCAKYVINYSKNNIQDYKIPSKTM